MSSKTRFARRLALMLALSASLGTPTSAGDGPVGVLPVPAARRERHHRIAPGAITAPVPGVAQRDDYSCGAAALMAVCSSYGVGPRKLEAFKRRLRTDPDRGTDFREIIRYAGALGLQVDWKHGMTTAELEAHLSRGRPVICAIQAYADDPAVYADRESNECGHYVVAIGFDGDGFLFMDPSLGRRRGFLPRAEFVRRWHDNEGSADWPDVHERLGIAVFPKPGGTPFLNRARRIE
jgi:predicted double-glycine peptidase